MATDPADNPHIKAYLDRMQDPEYRASMERTEPFTAEEEAQLYAMLDEAFADLFGEDPETPPVGN